MVGVARGLDRIQRPVEPAAERPALGIVQSGRAAREDLEDDVSAPRHAGPPVMTAAALYARKREAAEPLAREKARGAVARSKGSRHEAGRLLWAWSRQDASLKEALCRVGADRIAADLLRASPPSGA
jgi:hypothetical protein